MMSDEDRAVLMGHASIDQFAEPTWEGDETKVEKLQELGGDRKAYQHQQPHTDTR